MLPDQEGAWFILYIPHNIGSRRPNTDALYRESLANTRVNAEKRICSANSTPVTTSLPIHKMEKNTHLAHAQQT